MDHSIVLKSYGKINLGLDVLRRREDGYHEVRMIMQTVGLYDVLTMKKRKDDKIEMTCNLSFLPTDERNLVYKAVKRQLFACHVRATEPPKSVKSMNGDFWHWHSFCCSI